MKPTWLSARRSHHLGFQLDDPDEGKKREKPNREVEGEGENDKDEELRKRVNLNSRSVDHLKEGVVDRLVEWGVVDEAEHPEQTHDRVKHVQHVLHGGTPGVNKVTPRRLMWQKVKRSMRGRCTHRFT